MLCNFFFLDDTSDFQALMSESFVFLSGTSIGTRSCTSVMIEDDDTTENDELFQVVLTSTLSQVLIFPNVTKDILILNDDGKNWFGAIMCSWLYRHR